MTINKKLLLGLGAMTIVAAPLISVVSCSSNNEKKDLGFKAITNLDKTIATQETNLKTLDDANIAFLKNRNDENAQALADALKNYFTDVTKDKVLETDGLKINKVDAPKVGTNASLNEGDTINIDVLGTDHSSSFIISAPLVELGITNKTPIIANLELSKLKTTLKAIVDFDFSTADKGSLITNLENFVTLPTDKLANVSKVEVLVDDVVANSSKIDEITPANKIKIKFSANKGYIDFTSTEFSTTSKDLGFSNIEINERELQLDVLKVTLGEIVSFRMQTPDKLPLENNLAKFFTLPTDGVKNVYRVVILVDGKEITNTAGFENLATTNSVVIKLEGKPGYINFTSDPITPLPNQTK